jgi:molybdopterin-synthase adenylyltransferase
MQLSTQEIERYARQIMVKEIGGAGQQKLAAAKVSIVGAGALGGPCALYLAAAGVGQIELVDDDRVERSNLARQIQFAEADTGTSKVETLARRLLDLNPHIGVLDRRERFAPETALIGDVLIDATDNFETRFALNRLAHASGRRLVSGAAGIWAGQVGVFESGLVEDAPCYQCFIPETPPDAADCETIGVIGPVTGIVGARMALETLKLITGAGVALVSHLWIFDALRGRERTVKVQKDMKCAVCGRY